MKGLATIFKKECLRYFTDYRMLIALFLPGILIFVLYMSMGNIMTNIVSTPAIENTVFHIAYTDDFGEGEYPKLVSLLEATFTSEGKGNTLKTYPLSEEESLSAKEEVKKGTYDVYLDYSPSFEDELLGEKVQTLNIYYNGASEKATYLYELTSSLVSFAYNGYLLNQENGFPIDSNVAEENFRMDQVASFLIPLLTTTFLFSPIISLAPESIAGEKERGTLATLLITPVSRSAISWGKILAISLASLASALVSFLGVFFSIPSILPGFQLSFDSAFPILILFLLSDILFVGIGIAISAFAKSIKEANAYLGGLLTLMMVVSLLSSILDFSALPFAFIPVFNISSCMSLILKSSTFPWLYMTITIVVTALAASLVVFFANRLFRSEKIMLRK